MHRSYRQDQPSAFVVESTIRIRYAGATGEVPALSHCYRWLPCIAALTVGDGAFAASQFGNMSRFQLRKQGLLLR